jgi:bacterioferritin-associated ferredoxin
VIVCQCRVVNDQAIRDAATAGATSVAQVCRMTGAGRDCGSCVFTVKRLLCEHEEFAFARSRAVEVEGAAS